MHEWAKTAADAIRPRIEALKVEDDKANQDQKQKRLQEAAMWEAISAKALEGCNAINAQLGRPLLSWSRDSEKNVLVGGTAGAKKVLVVAKFLPDDCAILWDERRYNGIIDGGRLLFRVGSSEHPALDAEDMGKEIVIAALDKLKDTA
jgi:hypothetical protein